MMLLTWRALTADPPVWDEYRQTIQAAGLNLTLQPIEKWAFYEAVSTPDHVSEAASRSGPRRTRSRWGR
jgi:L-fucose mutarotase/ribose pyranase (RbsD/FucU family)